MINYGGVILDSDTNIGREDLINSYFINCCGYVKIANRSISLTRRRLDYYLVYLINGVGHYRDGDSFHTIQPGNIILYRPLDEQDYYYVGGEQAELYWIHFTGTAVQQLLRELGLEDSRFYPVGILSQVTQLFETMIHEINIKNPGYHALSIGYLIQILSMFSRQSILHHNGHKGFKNNDIEHVIKKMHLEYQQNHPIGYYADSCNISIYQFIRKFQKSMQTSPARYIEKLRIDKSKELLSDTDLTVSEISNVVGFNDPFYFSKVFKKNTGHSPVDFRKRKKAYIPL